MTSRNLFFRLLVQDFRKRIWCPICIFILEFLAMEVTFLMKIDEMIKSPEEYSYSIGEYVSNVFFTPDNNYFMLMIMILSAIVCGISGFSYLHSKKQLDVYHSLPVKRRTLYCVKYISGILYFIFPLLIHTIICLIFSGIKGAFTISAVSNAFGYIFTQFILFLAVYGVSIIAVCLTGNLIISIVGADIMLTYSLILTELRDLLYEKFYYTNVPQYNSQFPAFSPVHMIVKLLRSISSYRMENNQQFLYECLFHQLLFILVAAFIFGFVGFILYKIRPTENSGRTIVFPVAEGLIKAAIVIPLSLYCGLFMDEVSLYEDSFGWYLFGVILGFVLSALIIEIAFRMDIRNVFHHSGQLLFDAACVGLLVAIFKTDALGYNTYIPSDGEIEDCSVSIDGLLYASSQSPEGYVSATDYRMEHVHIADNPSILLLARKAAAEGLQYQENSNDEMIENEEYYRDIVFGYHLKNGKSVFRKYYIDINDSESLQLLTDVFNDTDYKANSMPLFANGWNTYYDAVICTGQYETGSIKLDESRQAQLLEAYQSEFMKLTLEEVMNSQPVAMLEFMKQEKDSYKYSGRYSSYYSEYGYTVYPSFVRTIELLKQYGFDCKSEEELDKIDTVLIRDTTKEYGEGVYPEVIYSDKDKIAAILENSLQDELLYGVYDYLALDENYIVITNITGTYDEYSSHYGGDYYLPRQGQLPDFVIEDLAKQAQILEGQ